MSGVRETGAMSGKPGVHGIDGPSGAAGDIAYERADVHAKFENLGAIVPL